MPRRTLSARDQSLADLVVARWRQVEQQRKPRETVWDRSYQDHDPQYIDPSVDSPPKVKFPYLHRVTSIQTTAVMEATDANGRWLLAQPASPGEDNRRRSEAVTEFLETQYRWKSCNLHDNNGEALERVLQMGLKYGNSYCMVEWERQGEHFGVRLKSLDPYDVWLDASYGRFYILRRTVSVAQLASMAEGLSQPGEDVLRDDAGEPVVDPETGHTITVQLPPRDGGRAMRAFRNVLSSVKKGERPGYVLPYHAHGLQRRYDSNRVSGDGHQVFDTDEEVSPDKDPFNALVTVLEMYETEGGGLCAKVIPDYSAESDNLVLQAETNPWGACPIVPFLPYRVDNEFYGMGNGEIVGLLARAMDYNLRGGLAVIAATAWPPLLHAKSANLRQQYLKELYGKAFEVRDPSRDMMFMQQDISPAFHQIGQQIAQSAADFGTGESELRRGNVGQARNATAAAIGEAFANLTDKFVFRHWRSFMEHVGHVCIAVARVHMTKTGLFPVLGRRTVDFLELRPEYFRGHWCVTFGGNPRGANPAQMLAGHIQIASTYGASGQIDLRESARESYRLLGERDPDRFLMQKDEAIPLSPQDEHQKLLDDGVMPVISPRENLIEHFQAHSRALIEWQQVLSPQDTRFQKLQAHAQATILAIQSQQGALGGMGGGVAPFTPDQAGQPGQPATFQPAVAGINEQRQMSNGATPGQAPGGIAPGRQTGEVATGGAR